MRNKLILCLIVFVINFFNCFAETDQCFETEKNFYLNLETNLDDVKKEAEKGCFVRQFSLGCYYLHAGKYLEGRIIDKEKGLYWLRESAEQGNHMVQTELGRIYLLDEFKDTRKALYWLYKAADQGNAEAMGYLSVCYVKGDGVLKDYEEAVKWLILAATRGCEKSIKIMNDFENTDEYKLVIKQGKERARIWIKEHPHAMMSPD
jgi:TPR repeat protein